MSYLIRNVKHFVDFLKSSSFSDKVRMLASQAGQLPHDLVILLNRIVSGSHLQLSVFITVILQKRIGFVTFRVIVAKFAMGNTVF